MSDSPEDAEKTRERMSALAHPAMLGEQLRPADLSHRLLPVAAVCDWPAPVPAASRGKLAEAWRNRDRFRTYQLEDGFGARPRETSHR